MNARATPAAVSPQQTTDPAKLVEPTKSSTEDVRSMNLHQRLSAIRRHVDYLQKMKKVEGYMAVTHDQVTKEIREHLIHYGVLILPPSVVSGATVPTGTFTARQIPFIRYEGVFDVTFVNVDKPEERETVRIPAHALDHGDKAPGKALSYVTKGAILKMFNIETGEESEEDRPKDQQGGMSVKELEEWEEKISKVTNRAGVDALWAEITAACEKLGDTVAFTRLKARMSAKVEALRKAAKERAAAEKAGAAGQAENVQGASQ